MSFQYHVFAIKTICMALFISSGVLAGITFKPHYGYLFPRMVDVNGKIENDIRSFRKILGEPIPSPGKINGNRVFGAQIEYHLNENYFMNMNISFYRESASVFYTSQYVPSAIFNYEREVELYDVMINLLYYIDYNTWRRFNTYIGMGVGLVVANARSVTETTFDFYPLNSRGEFSGNTLSGVLSAGANYRLTTFAFLWGEIGLQYGNMGQLDGSVTTLENPEKRKTITESSFDFTGIYLRAGVGITLPFLD